MGGLNLWRIKVGAFPSFDSLYLIKYKFTLDNVANYNVVIFIRKANQRERCVQQLQRARWLRAWILSKRKKLNRRTDC
ncbi:MAG: hypothetical protein BMS9Abin02_1935 [Anaerolineae bacterium]|nr:MAG: hypothetical protein BMS9Abin02_1935 [Anaerolineae bacterium]